MYLRRLLCLALLIGLVCSFGSAAITADTSNTSDSHLISNVNASGGLIVGNLLFSNFVVTSQGTSYSGSTAITPDASAISITGVLMGGDYGLRFDGGWVAPVGQISSSSIDFKITVLDSSHIVGNELWMSTYGVINFDSTDNGGVGISEVIYGSDPGQGYSPPINDNEEVFFYTDAAKQLYDSDDFDTGYTEIWVNKGITVYGGTSGTGFAQLNQFYQLYGRVPEPATIGLLLVSGAVIFRKKK